MGYPLTEITRNGLELSLFPWEDAAVVIADIEAMLDETYAKPWLMDEDVEDLTTEPTLTRFWSGAPSEVAE